MGIVDVIGNAVDALYMHKKEFAEFQRIKRESGLMEQDWNAIWESISRYPVEVQTVLEAKNEDHVKLYDQDVRDVLDIQEETKQLLNDEVPDLFWIDFFKTIQLHTCDPIVTIFEIKKSKHIDMNCCMAYRIFCMEGSPEEIFSWTHRSSLIILKTCMMTQSKM